MEKKIELIAKLEAIKTYIYSLQKEYAKLQDDESYDGLQSYQKIEIKAKENILIEIKDFVESM